MLPVFRLDILKLLLTGHARVIHQQAHRAQLLLNALNHGFYRRPVRHIRLMGDGPKAQRIQRGGQILRLFPLFDVIDADGPAVLGQQRGRGRADAPGGPGDQCNIFHL